MSRLETRLNRLERVTASRLSTLLEARHEADASDAQLEAAWQIMQATMSEEHVRIVWEAYAAGLHEPLGPDYHTPAARLLRRCLSALTSRPTYWPYSEIADEVAYAMPPPVADVYLARDELPLHDCEDCGFSLPQGYFESCPLCGGRIGWYAYFEKHQNDPQDVSETSQ